MHTRLLIAAFAASLGAAGCSADQAKTSSPKDQEWTRSGAEWPHAGTNYFAPDGGASKETAQVEATDVMPPPESSELAPDTGATPPVQEQAASPSSESSESSASSEPSESSGRSVSSSKKDESKSFTAASEEGKSKDIESSKKSEQASASKPVEEDTDRETRTNRTGAYLAAGVGVAALLAFAGSRRRRHEDEE